MTRPATDSDQPDASSRRTRLEARRHRRVRIATATFVILVIAAGVAAAVYAVDDRAVPFNAARATPSPSAAFGQRALPQVDAGRAPAVRLLSHANPLRLWVGGDSLAGLFGAALGDEVGATGVVKTRVDYKVSSGLWSNDLRNWPERAAEEMKSDNPDVVVYIIGANDTSAVNKVDANNDGVPDWEADYRAKVDVMMNTFVGTQRRTVFWLGAPTLGTESADTAAIAINRVVKQEAAQHAPNVVYVDTYHLFEGPNGGYSRSIVDENGDEITARISDGVHFTQDGSAYLARAVFTLVEARFKVKEQADIAHPIGWAFATGSGESVPGYNQVPRSRYRNRSSSCCSSSPTSYDYSGGGETPTTFESTPTTVYVPPVTTPPATTPPATNPPATTPPITGG